MHQSSNFLRRSRRTKYTYGHNHALFTSSDGMAASDIASPKDTTIIRFFDWSVVSNTPNISDHLVQASKIYC